MLKNLLVAAAAIVLLAPAAEAKAKPAKSPKPSTAHHCVKDGAEIKTSEKTAPAGRKIKRKKTCAKEGGEWALVAAAAAPTK